MYNNSDVYSRSYDLGELIAHAVKLNPALKFGTPFITARTAFYICEYFDLNTDSLDITAAVNHANEKLHLNW